MLLLQLHVAASFYVQELKAKNAQGHLIPGNLDVIVRTMLYTVYVYVLYCIVL